MKLDFKESTEYDEPVWYTYFKGVKIFTIRYSNEINKYWICTFNSFIEFRYFHFSKERELDFIEPYKYSKTLEGAKKNCKHIMYSYINWLIEK